MIYGLSFRVLYLSKSGSIRNAVLLFIIFLAILPLFVMQFQRIEFVKILYTTTHRVYDSTTNDDHLLE